MSALSLRRYTIFFVSRVDCFGTCQGLVAYSPHSWVVDSGATNQLARKQDRFVEYRRIPVGAQRIFMGNKSSVLVLGVGKLDMRHGRTLFFHEVLYAPGI